MSPGLLLSAPIAPMSAMRTACGNVTLVSASVDVREQSFADIWNDSPQLNEVRAIRLGDLQGCSSCVHGGTCSRCPGLAYLEGNMRGPSTQDCEKSFARTGVPSKNLERKRAEAKPRKELGIPILLTA